MKIMRLALLMSVLTGCQTTVTTSPIPVLTPPLALPSASPEPTLNPNPSPVASVSPSASPTPTATPIPATPQPSPKNSPSPSPQGTSVQSVVNIPANADLAKIFSALKANTTYILAPKAVYFTMGTFIVSQPNVVIDLNGSSVSMPPAAGSSSTFAVHAANFEVKNGHITKAFTFIHSYAAGLHADDLKFDNITYAVPPGSPAGTKPVQNNGVSQVYTSDNNGAVHNTLENLTVGYTGTVSVYNSADDFTLKNSTFAGSYGEYCFRSEITSGGTNHYPKNTLIDHMICDNTINGYGKSCIGIRMGGTGMIIQNSSLTGSATTGYMNLGQGGGAKCMGCNVKGISLINNSFLGPRMPQLEIDAGVNAIVQGNSFNTWADSPNVAMATFSTVTLKDNIRIMIPPGTKPLKRFAGSNTNPPAVWTESGTVVK